MVSFSCEECGDVLTKKKLDPHRSRCRGATFTCIDCMVHFPGFEYRSHTSCMTEDQKYQGALYKDKSKKQKNNTNNKPADLPKADATPTPKMATTMAHNAYVEDVGEDREYESWDEDDGQTDDERSPSEPPPEAPTPPSAVPPAEDVNVFDYLVATGQTPNASKMNLPQNQAIEITESTSLVRYEYNAEEYLDPTSVMEDDGPLISYGSGPVPSSNGPFVTPATKSERRKTKDGELKKDKKRKRLHVDVPGDQVMTDAPPVLHSGLTGGLNRLMRPALPPSPDYSGGDVAPASPLKKSRHTKHSKNGQVTNSLFGMLTGATKKNKKVSTKKRSHRSRDDKKAKLIEYRPRSRDSKGDADGQVIIYKPRGDLLLGFVKETPENEYSCSMNKALRRFHRAREASGTSLTKGKEERELWKSLRLRRNDRGEIVLFSEDLDFDDLV